MTQQSGILREGARRVWKRQRIVWWFFVVNLVLAWIAAVPYRGRLTAVTAHSLSAERLVNGFDLGTYSELIDNPDVAHEARLSESGVAVFVYFLFVLFASGGVIEAYAADRKLTTGEFFQACGAFFWRWVRLLLVLLIVLTPIGLLSSGLFRWSGRLMLNTVNEKPGYWVGLGVFVFATLVAMLVRLWFDMAQVRTVIDDEHGMIRTAVRSFGFTLSNFGSLFWLYLRISILAWLGLFAGLWLWAHIPGNRSGLSFLILEAVLLWWIGTRLWQRASETLWYLRESVAQSAPSMVETTTVQSSSKLSGALPTN
jgi:hypothetical protein